MSDTSVLVVGLDAACFDQLNPLLGEGTLPNIERLLSSGVGAPLETTTPPWTPSAWPSVVTGSKPWTHGVYDFYHYESDKPRHVSARDVRVPYLWEILSACGYSSIVVNVPVTHPPHAFDGSLVPGYIAAETTNCLLNGEQVSIDSLDESYRIYPRDSTSRRERLREYAKLITSRADMAEYLDRHHEWSFMMVQFQSTDAVFHTMGDDEDAVQQVFEQVDTAIGSLLDLAEGNTNVFVVSDHGMHRYEHIFHCNTWLRDQDYLQTAVDSSRWTWNERTQGELKAGDADGADIRPAITNAIITGLRRIGITPARVEHALSRVGLENSVTHLIPESILIDIVDASDHVDWNESRAYCRSSAALGIRCNVADRDPEGIVPPEEFDTLRETLVDELRELTGPTDRPIFERVYDRHQVHGANVANECSAPDIVVRPANMVWEVSDIVRDQMFVDTNKYNHSYQGLFIATGRDVLDEPVIEPTVVDIGPTILALFGIEPLPTMDGEILTELFAGLPERRETPSIGDRDFLGNQYPRAVSQTVQDQLREMGYLE